MDPDQADLLHGGWSPGRGRVAKGETTDSDVVASGFVRIKHGLAHVDLHLLRIGIDVLELSPDGGVGCVHGGEP